MGISSDNSELLSAYADYYSHFEEDLVGEVEGRRQSAGVYVGVKLKAALTAGYRVYAGDNHPAIVQIASSNGAMEYPTVLAIGNDGQMQQMWSGQNLPLMNELSSYIQVQ